MAAQASNEWTSLPGELPTPKGGFGTSTQSNTPQEHPMTSQVCDYIFVCFQRFWEGPKLSRQKRPRDRMIDTATTMQYTMSTSEKIQHRITAAHLLRVESRVSWRLV